MDLDGDTATPKDGQAVALMVPTAWLDALLAAPPAAIVFGVDRAGLPASLVVDGQSIPILSTRDAPPRPPSPPRDESAREPPAEVGPPPARPAPARATSTTTRGPRPAPGRAASPPPPAPTTATPAPVADIDPALLVRLAAKPQPIVFLSRKLKVPTTTLESVLQQIATPLPGVTPLKYDLRDEFYLQVPWSLDGLGPVDSASARARARAAFDRLGLPATDPRWAHVLTDPNAAECTTSGAPATKRRKASSDPAPPAPRAPPAPTPVSTASSLRSEFASRHPAYLASWRAVHAARDTIAHFANLHSKLLATRAGSNAEAAVLREIEAAAEKWDAVALRETVAKWQEMHAEMERLRVRIVQVEAREEVAVAEAAAANATARSRG
ncbi:hypothetical protein GGF31_005119 [Allomyces arbusculus]|nr:hypothetical protein GGF31_005119 [Allomyces arbusculus]